MELIERVGRALFVWEWGEKQPPMAWEELPEETRGVYFEQSRAAIEVLYEPSEKPFGLQSGPWSWRSYTAGENAGKTIVMVGPLPRGGFQFWLTLDWTDYDDSPDIGRTDAEKSAAMICNAVNLTRTIGAALTPITGDGE